MLLSRVYLPFATPAVAFVILILFFLSNYGIGNSSAATASIATMLLSMTIIVIVTSRKYGKDK
jgi:hypothetical protein